MREKCTKNEFVFEKPLANIFARLVYCKSDQVEEIKEKAKKNPTIKDVKVNEHNLGVLRPMKKGDLYIVNDKHPHFMRGFDYRCD